MAAAGLVGQKVGFYSSPEDQMNQALRGLAKEASINRQNHHANQNHEADNAESEKESIARLFQQLIAIIPLSGALQYVSTRLSIDPNRKSTVLAKDSALIQIVGGRLTDWQKIESGLDLERAKRSLHFHR
ncbi:mitochondrial escape protein 2 [Puccinia graminis f. sp. tritici]|uniref:Mitochondrial escape protein 2 n=1 Tax=Puccinia graminis f. sp. tritici TaxID=56615 RepID=A0A5B0P7J4_PUCGR|nr:mitochondrial escape protein 2 [Puccinia graminis f. sp. tritici]